MRKFKVDIITCVLIAFFSFSPVAMAQALLQIGAQAPEFTLNDISGREVSLSGFSAKKAVIIVFWSTWSSKSAAALKRFEEFQRKYGEKGIQVIGINTENQHISGEDIEKVKKTVAEMGISFPVLFDRELKTFHDYSCIALPSTVVLSEGKIVYELPGLPLVKTEDMFDYLLALAGEQPKKKVEPGYKPRHDAIADTNLGRGFVKKKMYAMAYPFFRKAIEKDPKYMLPYVELARLHEADGNTEEAEKTLKDALAIEPLNVAVMSELGYLLSRTGKVEESIEVLDKAAKMNSYTPSHYYLAYALGKKGRTAEALAAFEEALSLNPFEKDIYLLRGEIFEAGGMFEKAAADYRKALELMLRIKN
jgi:tetratricopeptide (TPR) repeat protein